MLWLILWILRAAVIIVLCCYVLVFRFLLRHRTRFPKLIENKTLNMGFVILYNACCFLATSLIPEDPQGITKPHIFAHPVLIIGFCILGIAFISLHAWLIYKTLRKRNVIGIQNTKDGLIASGVYAYFRHPIYVGIVGISLGLALLTLNWDGMLVWPLILIINLIEAKIEEKNDLLPRFKESYETYQDNVRIFGNLWYWLLIAVPIFSLILLSFI